jgi:hypothetical protein
MTAPTGPTYPSSLATAVLGPVLRALPTLARVLVQLPELEWKRLSGGPRGAVTSARRRGLLRRHRSPVERQQLRRVIGWVDAVMPGGSNCYRRALLEMALDSGAAREPLRMGLRATGGPRTGHAWLGDDSDSQAYDAVVSV